jgi:phage tail sheath gpL-like
VVTWTARHKGTLGNSIDVRTTYQPSDAIPAGVTVAPASTTVGAGDPDGSAVFTAIGDNPFTDFVWPWNDATNLTNLETALAARWAYDKMIDGIGWYAATGSFNTVSTLGTSRNSALTSFVGVRGALNPPWELAGWWGAVNGLALSIDPGRPTQTLPAPGILAPILTDRWTRDERDLLLRDGVSTFVVDSGGNVAVDRAITTKQTDSNGLPTVAWLDVNVPATLSYLRYSLRGRISAKFPRHKLADDGTPFSPGQAVVTPKILRGEIVAWAKDLADAAIIENLPGFIAQLKVERDASDQNRANALIPPDLVNGFRVFAGQIQYII